MDYRQAKQMAEEIWGNFMLKLKEMEDAQEKKPDTEDLLKPIRTNTLSKNN